MKLSQLTNAINFISGFATGVFTGIIVTSTSVAALCAFIKTEEIKKESKESIDNKDNTETV
jgi:hypothetical protein